MTSTGYIGVTVPKDINSSGFELEHRLIMQQVLGRKLRTDEHVHHINRKKQDNDIANLELISASDHARLTIREATALRRALRREKLWLEAQIKRYERIYGKLPPME